VRRSALVRLSAPLLILDASRSSVAWVRGGCVLGPVFFRLDGGEVSTSWRYRDHVAIF